MVSIIIATYNRAWLLAQTLAALARQDAWDGAIEVIIADNGSTDDTAAVAREAAERGLRLRYIHVPEPGKSHAMNAGVSAADGDLLLMTDDDVVPERGWVRGIVEAFDNPHADFVVGRILPRWGAPPPTWMSPSLYGVLAVPDNGPTRRVLTRDEHHGIMAIGTNMAVRRAVVSTLGGWRTDLGKLRGTYRNAEDHEFFLRMLDAGCIGVYEPGALVHHFVSPDRLTPAYFRRWLWTNGRIVARLEDEFPTTTRYVAGAPGYLWRRAGQRAAGLGQALLSADRAAAFAHAMHVVWFTGYLRERWLGRAERPAAVPVLTSPGENVPS